MLWTDPIHPSGCARSWRVPSRARCCAPLAQNGACSCGRLTGYLIRMISAIVQFSQPPLDVESIDRVFSGSAPTPLIRRFSIVCARDYRDVPIHGEAHRDSVIVGNI
jgi:hypothetical protein